MKKFDFKQPDFLFCEIVIKDGTENDDRIWIYHRKSLSLIEFINVDNFKDFQFTGKQDRFEYLNENWFGVFVQNNCETTDYNSDKVLKAAWEYLKDYMIWEHDNQKM
jgi:hypothetical protein